MSTQTSAIDLLKSLPPEIVSQLPESQRNQVMALSLDTDELLRSDQNLQEASKTALKIFSLLSCTEVDTDWLPLHDALDPFEEKALIAMLKKLMKLECFKLRKPKVNETPMYASTTTTREADDTFPL